MAVWSRLTTNWIDPLDGGTTTPGASRTRRSSSVTAPDCGGRAVTHSPLLSLHQFTDVRPDQFPRVRYQPTTRTGTLPLLALSNPVPSGTIMRSPGPSTNSVPVGTVSSVPSARRTAIGPSAWTVYSPSTT